MQISEGGHVLVLRGFDGSKGLQDSVKLLLSPLLCVRGHRSLEPAFLDLGILVTSGESIGCTTVSAS